MAKTKPRLPPRKEPFKPRTQPRQRSQHYKECEARWDKAEKEGGDWPVDQPKWPVDAGLFFATLRMLAEHTQDRRLDDLYHELKRSILIDPKTDKWSRFGTTLANPLTWDMCELIEESVTDRGFEEREAIADAVAELGLKALSFAAGCKRVTRLFAEYHRVCGTQNRKKKSNAQVGKM